MLGKIKPVLAAYGSQGGRRRMLPVETTRTAPAPEPLTPYDLRYELLGRCSHYVSPEPYCDMPDAGFRRSGMSPVDAVERMEGFFDEQPAHETPHYEDE